MTQEETLHRIKTLLARFQEEVTIENANGEFSINIHAENVLLKVLNVAYDLNLRNVNYEEGKTFPAIDLRDEDRRIAFQITSTGTVDKAVHTLKECVKNGFDTQFDELYIYFLKEKDKNVKTDTPRIIKEKGSFELANIHFLDHNAFYVHLNQIKDLGKLIEIKNLLEEQFADPILVEEKLISTQGVFDIGHPDRFFGREKKIEKVLSWIGKEKIILVSGEGGIGKTEFCREILSRAKQRSMSYTAVNLIECRTYEDMIRRIAGRQGIALGANDKANLIEQVVLGKLNGILYLDNFEDLISEKNSDVEQQEQAVSFLRKCHNIANVTVLISSRYKLEVDFALEEVELDVLDEEAAVQLFSWLWTRDDSMVADDKVRDFVIKDLYRYPLSIVLAAKQRKVVYSIERLKEKWKTHWKEVTVRFMDNKRHHSLATALHMTYMEVRDKENERELWELFTLFPDQIEIDAAEKIIDGYDEAIKNLVNLGVVHIHDEYLSVQPTLRQFIKETEEFLEDIQKVSAKLLDYYGDIYGESGIRNWGTEQESYAAEHLPDALFFMNHLLEQEDVTAIGRLHRFICEYYQGAPYEAIIPVEKAVSLPNFGEIYSKANLLEYCGDLEMRTDKLVEAEEHYKEAESVYRRIHDDLGLANVLKAMGDLEMRTAKLVEAESHYKEAESVYRRIHADLGLANVLKAMGDLERRTAKLVEAESHYKEAESVYHRIHADLGLANVLQAMGDIWLYKESYDKALGLYMNANSLYKNIDELIGLTVTTAKICLCSAINGDNGNVTHYANIVNKLCSGLPYEDVKRYCNDIVEEALKLIEVS